MFKCAVALELDSSFAYHLMKLPAAKMCEQEVLLELSYKNAHGRDGTLEHFKVMLCAEEPLAIQLVIKRWSPFILQYSTLEPQSSYIQPLMLTRFIPDVVQ